MCINGDRTLGAPLKRPVRATLTLEEQLRILVALPAHVHVSRQVKASLR